MAVQPFRIVSIHENQNEDQDNTKDTKAWVELCHKDLLSQCEIIAQWVDESISNIRFREQLEYRAKLYKNKEATPEELIKSGILKKYQENKLDE